jgi:PAS domain S-box-containing protein
MIIAELFIPHGHCYLWKPELVGLHIISDALTALAYYSIPLMLVYFVAQRRDVPFNWIFLLFGAFIVSCGTTHIMEIWTLWHPHYWLSGAIKAFAAIVSLYTAGELRSLLPQALTMPSAAEFEAVQTESQEHQRVKIELLREKTHLAKAQKVAHVGSWELDLATQAFTGSHEAFRICGFDPDQPNLTLSEYQQQIHPDDRRQWEETLNQMIQGQSCELEFRIVRPDGSIRYLLGQGEPILRKDGEEVEKLFGTILDISDRVIAQEQERLVAAIALKIRQSLELDDILNTTVTEVREFLQTDRVLIYRFNPDWSGQVVVESTDKGCMGVLDSTIHDPCFGKDYSHLYRNGRVRAINNIYTAGLTPCYVEMIAQFQVVAVLTVPILVGETLWGLLIAHHCRGERQWKMNDIELLEQLATQVAIAIQQSELYSRVQAELIERQRTEKELRTSEERYRSVITAMSEGIVLQQADGRITACNISAERILGLAAQQILGRNSIDPSWQTIYEDGSPFPGELHPAMITLHTGQPQSNVIMGIRKLDETLTWISINSQPLFQPGDTQPYAVVTSFTDITARKQAEEALRESEQKFRAIFDSVQDGILITNDEGDYLNANPAARTWLGLVRDTLNGQPIWRTRQSQSVSQAQIFWQSCLAQGQMKGEYRFQLPDGSLKDVEYSAVANFLPGRHLSVLHDITERKQSELALRALTQQEREKAQQLEQTLKQLQRTQAQLVQNEKMVSLGQLVAGVAHEINNPTSFIYGNIEPATEYTQDLLHLVSLYRQYYPEPIPEIVEHQEGMELDFVTQDFPKLLESMREGANRITEIVKSLRNFSRLDERERKPVDIHQGIDNTLLILKHRLTQHLSRPDIQVIKQYGVLPLVECYPGQLNQVFMNILTNAIDALDDVHDSRLRMHGKEHYPTIEIHTQVIAGNRIAISISDNGIGINPHIQLKIFDPFFTTKPPGKGTGLGLSISYQIVVDKHGGQLRCHSVPGRGTAFMIKLPITPRNDRVSCLQAAL